MESLGKQLSDLRALKESKRDPALTALMSRGTEELRATGISDGVPGLGDTAPSFARPDLSGSTVRLRTLLRAGPVVVSFFRGRW